MKNLFFFGVLFTLCLQVNAQSEIEKITKKVDAAPANEYGVKRLINYGAWDTAASAKNTWIFFAKDEGYFLCTPARKGGKVISIYLGLKENQPLAEKILKELDEKKWWVVYW